MSKFSPNSSSQSLFRLLIFLVVALIIGGILLSLPVPVQQILLGFMILVGIGIIPENRSMLRQTITDIQSAYQRHALRLARVSLFIMLLLIGLSAHFYQPQYYDSTHGFYLFLASLIFVRLSFPLLPDLSPPAESAETQSASTANIRWVWIAASVGCMVVLTLMNAPQAWLQPNLSIFFGIGKVHEQMLVLCIGLLTLLYGFGVRFNLRRFQWQRHHTILSIIILVASVMRLWNLEETARFFMDEFHFIKGIITIDGNYVQLLHPSSNAFTDIFSYLQVIPKSVLGANLAVLRIPSALFGIWGVLGVYTLAKELFDLRIALLSAFLVALMPAHIHFSRIGINNIAGPTLGIWCFAYMVRGMRYRKVTDFALAGVFLGLTHYFYEGDRLFFTAFFVCWVAWIIVFCRRKLPFQLPNLKQFAVMGFCLLVVIAPLYHTFWSHNLAFATRFYLTRDQNVTLIDHTTNMITDNQFHKALQRYTQTETSDGFYQSEYAYVIAILVPFFLLGSAVLLWRIFTLYGALFIWWAFGVSVANNLILDTFSAPSPRYVVVYGTLMVITAVGIHTLWSALTGWVTNRLKLWVQVGCWLFLAGIGIYQINYYFATVVPNFHHRVYTKTVATGRHEPAHDDMMLRAIITLPDNTTLHVFTSLLFPGDLINSVPAYYGRAEEFEVVHEFSEAVTPDYFTDLPHDRNHVFTFTDYYAPILMKMMEETFDITEIEGSPYDIPDDVEMKFYHVSFK